ncbi:MAG: hypothetical protein F4X02_12575 [Chloroflexi bacterium]|nr:hypothetical protein [Chloroflexota bacterium]
MAARTDDLDISAVTIDVLDLIRYLRLSPEREYWTEGHPGYERVARLRELAARQVVRWAPEAPTPELNEAVRRLLAYGVQRLGGLSQPLAQQADGALPGLGPAEMLYSGAASLLQRWHPLEVGQID